MVRDIRDTAYFLHFTEQLFTELIVFGKGHSRTILYLFSDIADTIKNSENQYANMTFLNTILNPYLSKNTYIIASK